jgi:hypothetical protein
MTGVDLGFVPVVRTPAADATASALNARAFTHGAVVHVPETAGPLDRSDTEALVAHELAHVVQQRALGARARESEGLGDRLEQAAQEVESAFRGRRSADTVGDLLAGEVAAGPVVVEARDVPAEAHPESPALESYSSGPLSWTPLHGFRAEPGQPDAQRAELSDLAGQPAPGPASAGAAGPGSPASEAVPLEYPVLDELPAAGPNATQAGAAAQAPPAPPRPTLADLDEETLAGLAHRIGARLTVSPLNTRDPELLDQLAVQLYGRLRSRLRRELISDRERVGLLTEFH